MGLLSELYVWLSYDDEGNEALVGMAHENFGWLPLAFKTEAEAQAMAALIENLRQNTGRDIWLTKYYREQS